MHRITKYRPSPATLLALIALLVATAGTAVAAGGNEPTATISTMSTRSKSVTIPPGVSKFATAVCPTGQLAVSGGYKWGGNLSLHLFRRSGASKWTAKATGQPPGDDTLTTLVFCAQPQRAP
jgi:hypothetical protein